MDFHRHTIHPDSEYNENLKDAPKGSFVRTARGNYYFIVEKGQTAVCLDDGGRSYPAGLPPDKNCRILKTGEKIVITVGTFSG